MEESIDTVDFVKSNNNKSLSSYSNSADTNNNNNCDENVNNKSNNNNNNINTENKNNHQSPRKTTSIGRRLTRRLSLVTKVPSLLNASKLKQEILNTLESTDFFRQDTTGHYQLAPRLIEITLITPDKRQRLVTCYTGQTVIEVTRGILEEFSLTADTAKLCLAGSLAVVDISADVSLLLGDVMLIDHRPEPAGPTEGSDGIYRLTELLMYTEAEYVTALRSAVELYDNPIQISGTTANLNALKLCDSVDLKLSPIFDSLTELAKYCSQLITRINETLSSWDPCSFSVGEIFNDEFWNQYRLYLDSCRKSRQLLRNKHLSDENFVTICRLRQGAAKYSLGSLLQLPAIGSPLGSPVVSPISSPKGTRKGYGAAAKHLAHRRAAMKQEFREVQSDPEDTIGSCSENKKCKIKRKLDKRKHANKPTIEMISAPCPLLNSLSKSMGRLDGLKQVQRLSEYEQYFENLLNETRLENQRETEEINKIKGRCKQTLKRGQCESDLERIQDLFPNDCLRLYDTDALTMKVKGLMRKRSGPAARLHRALSTKSLRSDSPPSSRNSSITDGIEQRQFVMEAPVHFTAGVQSQDRHLFLFNDLLLIAKARSGGNFKLKEKVRISEIWLSKCYMDEVSELNKSEATSFVLGWPTTNVVVTFTTQAARDLWWNKLYELYRIENEKEPCSTNVQVVYYDTNTNIEYCKTFSVGPEETAKDCIRLALEHLEMRHLDSDQFQLWAKTAREESPYPLIGHERPFAIKLSCLRDSLSSEEGFDLDHCNNVHDPVARCHFILRSAIKLSVNENKKSFKKLSTRGMKIGHVFRKSVNNNSNGNNKEQSTGGCLFGLPLTKISDGESLPKPVMSMLYQVFAKGPFIQGIFRKSANARLVRELREKLDSGEDVSWEHVPVLVTAALLKDFLRSLPDPLLTSLLYPQWRAAIETANINTKLFRMKGVIAQLPKANHLLLMHFLCVLYHIARRSCHTLMSAANLGVCVGPSLLWSSCPNVGDDLRVVPAIVECLITHCEFLCGSHIPSLLGDLRDSGTEESDSMKRDDSSIDSLECSPPPRKDKMSLSRDSGLTMSDSQLYTPDEEESGSTSSSGYDPAFESHSKISPSISVPGNYVRVYGGWEERLNPNFQRQAWFRQRSRRSSSSNTANNNSNNSANNNNNVNKMAQFRRSASEESLLDSKLPPPTPPRRNKPPSSSSGCSTAAEREYHRDNYLPTVPTTVYKTIGDCNNTTLESSISSCSSSSACSSSTKANKNSSSNGGLLDDCSRKTTKSSAFIISREDADDIASRNSNNNNNSSSNNDSTLGRKVTPIRNGGENIYSNVRILAAAEDKKSSSAVIGFGAGDYYYTPKQKLASATDPSTETKNSECEDSSTLSDDDCTPHVSRSNSRGNEVSTLRHVAVTAPSSTGGGSKASVLGGISSSTNNGSSGRMDTNNNNCAVRGGRLKQRKEDRAAYRSRSVPPPPPYRPPPPATSRRAPITSYYLGGTAAADSDYHNHHHHHHRHHNHNQSSEHSTAASQPQKYVITRTFMDEESYV